MLIQVRTPQTALTSNLAIYAKRRLDFALGNRINQVRRILVTLRDINGPKGGVDQCCQILVRVDGQPDIIVEDTQAKWPAAVDSAVARLSRTLSRRFGKLRNRATKANGHPVFLEKSMLSDSDSLPVT